MNKTLADAAAASPAASLPVVATTMTPKTFAALTRVETIQKRFTEILKERAPQFLASLVNVVNSSEGLGKIAASNPDSIFKAAMIAATLDLPIDRNLGFAWVVPYGGKTNAAQFQMGWKGFVQLAQRTGQYLRINCIPVFKNQFRSYNSLTETLNADFSIDGDGEPIGYAAYFKLLNGFEKIQYFTRKKLLEHGRRYSKSFDKPDGAWQTNPDAMCLKTAVKNTLSKWGILSVELRRAMVADQAAIKNENLDAADSVDYVDAEVSPVQPREPGSDD